MQNSAIKLPESKGVTALKTSVVCPLCGGQNLKLITNNVRFNNKADVQQCEKCSLTFLDQNSFHFPKDFYEKEYHQTYLTHVEPDALNSDVYFLQ